MYHCNHVACDLITVSPSTVNLFIFIQFNTIRHSCTPQRHKRRLVLSLFSLSLWCVRVRACVRVGACVCVTHTLSQTSLALRLGSGF